MPVLRQENGDDSLPGAKHMRTNENDKVASDKSKKLSMAPAADASVPGASHIIENQDNKSDPKFNHREFAPSAQTRLGRQHRRSKEEKASSASSRPAVGADRDVENPPPEANLIEAEVAPDFQEALNEAVENALKQKIGSIVSAEHVAQDNQNQNNENENQNDDDRDEDEDEAKSRKKKNFLYGGIGVFLLILIIVLAVVFSSGGGDPAGSALELPSGDNANDSTGPPPVPPSPGNSPTPPPLGEEMTSAPTEGLPTTALPLPTPPPSSLTQTPTQSIAPPTPMPTAPPTPGPTPLPTAPPTIVATIVVPDSPGECTSAIPIVSGSTIATLSNELSTALVGDPICDVPDGSKGIWFKYALPEDRHVTVTVSQQDFSVKVSYYTGSCGNLFCGAKTSPSLYSDGILSGLLDAGKEHYFLVSGVETGSFQFNFDAPLPPANSFCSDAKEVSAGFIGQETSASSVPSVSNLVCQVEEDNRGLWYKYTPTGDAVVTLTLSNQETYLRLSYYTGSCDFLTCEGYTGTSQYSDQVLKFHAKADTTYHILVSGLTYSSAGTYSLRVDAPPPPSSSYCPGARNIAVGPSSPYRQQDSIVSTVPSFSSASCGVDPNDRGTWYRYTPEYASTTSVTVSGIKFYGRLSIYTGDCAFLTCEAAINVPTSSSSTTLKFNAVMGNDYYILVSNQSFSSDGGYEIQVEAPEPPSGSYCSGATNIVVGPSSPYRQQDSIVSTVPSFSSTSCGVDSDNRGTWYRYTPEYASITSVTVSGIQFYGRVSIYTGDCDFLTCEAATNAYTTSSANTLTFNAIAGNDYYILVSNNVFAEDGGYEIQVEAPEPPSSSYCSGATNIVVGPLSPFRQQDSIVSTVPSFSSSSCGVGSDNRGIWYRYTPEYASITSVSVSGIQFYGRVSIYTGDCAFLTCGGATNVYESSSATLTFNAIAGNDYYILVSNNVFAEDGGYDIQVEAPEPPSSSYCSGATNIIVGPTSPFRQQDSIVSTVPSFSSSSCGVDPNDRGTWYRYTPEYASITSVSVSDIQFFGRLSIYTGDCAFLTCEAATNVFESSSATLTFNAVMGNDYYILVSNNVFAEDGGYGIQVEAPESS